MNGEAVLRRELLDQLAHFSVADNREFHAYSKDAGSGVLKELPVERFYRALQVGRGHHHAQIQLRRALRNHARPDTVQGSECARGHACRMRRMFSPTMHTIA